MAVVYANLRSVVSVCAVVVFLLGVCCFGDLRLLVRHFVGCITDILL